MPVKVKQDFVKGPYGRKMDGYKLVNPRGITSDGKKVIVFVDIGGRTVKLVSIEEHDACRTK